MIHYIRRQNRWCRHMRTNRQKMTRQRCIPTRTLTWNNYQQHQHRQPSPVRRVSQPNVVGDCIVGFRSSELNKQMNEPVPNGTQKQQQVMMNLKCGTVCWSIKTQPLDQQLNSWIVWWRPQGQQMLVGRILTARLRRMRQEKNGAKKLIFFCRSLDLLSICPMCGDFHICAIKMVEVRIQRIN